jgi:hypothetical protein
MWYVDLPIVKWYFGLKGLSLMGSAVFQSNFSSSVMVGNPGADKAACIGSFFAAS